MLTVFYVGLVIISGFCLLKGIDEGKKKSEKIWEDNIQYITVKELEDIVAEMRANGADENGPIVMIKPDWLEDE